MAEKIDTLIIPRHMVALRFIELPSTDEGELAKMAEFQALKEVPYPKDEILISYKKIGSYKKGFSYVMLVIAKKQVMEGMMADKQDRLGHIRLETEVLYLSLLKAGIVKQDKVSLIMDIKKDYSEIIVIDGMKPIFSRGCRNEERFVNDMRHSILAYDRDKNNPEINDIAIVYANGVDIEDIKNLVRHHFNAPLNLYKYDKNLLDMDFAHIQDLLEIELLPVRYIDARTSKRNRKSMLLTYALVVIVMSLLSVVFLFKLHEKNKIDHAFLGRMNNMQVEVSMLNNLLKKIDVLKSSKERGVFIIDTLKESDSIMPDDIFLSSLDYDGKETISYKGSADDSSSVFNFVKILEKSKYFKKVEIRYAAKKEAAGKEITYFNITCQIN